MVLLERTRKKTPLSHVNQWRQRSHCNVRGDWTNGAPAYRSSGAIGYGARAIPKTYMSSRLQTAWTFRRVFLHNGACPSAGHIIACDYLPLMTHTTWELRFTGSLKYEIQKKKHDAVLLKHFAPDSLLQFISFYCVHAFFCCC